MASTNNLGSNTTTPLAESFLKGFEASRVLTKSVDTQLIDGLLSPKAGTTVDVRRPHDFKSDRTAAGDISSTDKSDILSGKATATVQEYFTVHMDWDEVDEATKLDKLDQILAPAAQRIVTDLELDFGRYMYKNCNLHYGTPGTVVDAWSDVAGAQALMSSMGVPNEGECYYVMNPFTTTNLANVQNGLYAGGESLVKTSWQEAMISRKFGNMQAMTSSCLPSYTSGTLSAGANRAGTLSGAPTLTYVGAKDTMTQVWAVTGFGSGADTIKAGEIIQVTGRNRLGLATRSAFTDATGAQILFSGTVTEDVTLSGGAGNVTIAGAGIYEANGQYNTTDTAIASGDVVTILNAAASTVYQPNLFYHKQAFGVGFVKLKKLYSTDTLITTKDGVSIRVCKYADGDANKQKVRFDVVPAYATFDPFKAGQGFGV